MDIHERLRRLGWFVVLAAFAALLIPRAVSWGMFLDGVTYATISRNLAFGQGEAWRPFYTSTSWPVFLEQPPLVFMLQSLWFRVFGDHFIVEKAYSVSTAVMALALIWAAWRLLTAEVRHLAMYAWVPALIWISIPRWPWAYHHNILENTLAVFVLAASILGFAAMDGGRRRAFIATMLAGVCVVGGVLSKGPVGLFPIAAATLLELARSRGRIRRAVVVSLGTGLTAALLLCLLWLNDAARANLQGYLDSHLGPALSGVRSTHSAESSGRLYIVTSLFRALLPAICMVAGAALVSYVRLRRNTAGPHRGLGALLDATGSSQESMVRTAVGCILIGLAATLPISVSHKQRAFYLVPSYAFFALGFGLPLAAIVRTWAARADSRRFVSPGSVHLLAGAATVTLLVSLVSAASLGKPYRDKDRYHEIKMLGTVLPKGTIVGTDPETGMNHLIRASYYRYLQVSLDSGPEASARDFWILPEGRTPPGEFGPVDLELGSLVLWERRQ